jgi:hypothetical protein
MSISIEPCATGWDQADGKMKMHHAKQSERPTLNVQRPMPRGSQVDAGHLLNTLPMDVKVVVMRIHFGCLPKKFLSWRKIAVGSRDHAGVEKKVRVFRSQR